MGVRLETSTMNTLEVCLLERAMKPNGSQIWKCGLLVCWKIWKSRFTFVFEGKRTNPMELIIHIAHDVREAKLLSPTSYWKVLRVEPQRWMPLRVGVIKMNCDTSWCSKTRIGGIDIIARESNATMVIGLNRRARGKEIEVLEGFKFVVERN